MLRCLLVYEVTTPFIVGLLSFINPCTLPLLPGYIGYLLKSGTLRRIVLAFSFTVGVLTTMSVLGFLMVATLILTSSLISKIITGVGLLIMLLGIITFFNIKLPVKLTIRVKPRGSVLIGGYTYGLLYGPMVFSCNFPIILSVFLYSAVLQTFIMKLLSIVIYGLGLSMPLAFLTLITGSYRESIVRKLSGKINLFNKISGIMITLAGLYIILYNTIILKYM